MKRFTNSNIDDFFALKQRLSHATEVFRECEFPPGCIPGHGRIGFEARPGGRFAMMVDHGIRIDATGPVRALFEKGEIVFDNFCRLVNFCQGPLHEAFNKRVPDGYVWNGDYLDDTVDPEPEALTNLDEVYSLIRKRTPFGYAYTSETQQRIESVTRSVKDLGYEYDIWVRHIEPAAIDSLMARSDQHFGLRQDVDLIEKLLRPQFTKARHDRLRIAAVDDSLNVMPARPKRQGRDGDSRWQLY